MSDADRVREVIILAVQIPASFVFAAALFWVLGGWIGLIPLTLLAVQHELPLRAPLLYGVSWLVSSILVFAICLHCESYERR